MPILHKDQTTAEQQERDVDVSRDFQYGAWDSPGPHYVRGSEIRVTIPYTGEGELFKVRPTSYTLSPPSADFGSSALILRVVGIQLDGKAVRAQIDKTTAEIEGYLNTLRGNAKGYNNSIKARARQQIDTRRSKLLLDQNIVAELGFPLKEREGVPRTYAPPEIKRRIKPSLPPQSTQPFKPEPALTSDDYEHILSVLDGMARVMEQSPSAFRSIDEESLRSHFLFQLNGHYQGQATGETFNYSGKTDRL